MNTFLNHANNSAKLPLLVFSFTRKYLPFSLKYLKFVPSFSLWFSFSRFKLPLELMKSEERLPLHKMKWGPEWVTSMKPYGRVFPSSYAVLTQLWRTSGSMSVFHTMPLLFNFPLGWAVIVMVRYLSVKSESLMA